MPVRILVVDDHPIVRHGLRTLLGGRPEWEIIDEGEDGIEAVEKADRLKPDVVVLDVSIPRMDGLEACWRIRKSVPKSEVLIVTQHDSPQMMREALGAGARGYIVKSDAARDLLAALEAVSQHKPFIAQNRGQVGILTKPTLRLTLWREQDAQVRFDEPGRDRLDFHFGLKISDSAYFTEVSNEAADLDSR